MKKALIYRRNLCVSEWSEYGLDEELDQLEQKTHKGYVERPQRIWIGNQMVGTYDKALEEEGYLRTWKAGVVFKYGHNPKGGRLMLFGHDKARWSELKSKIEYEARMSELRDTEPDTFRALLSRESAYVPPTRRELQEFDDLNTRRVSMRVLLSGPPIEEDGHETCGGAWIGNQFFNCINLEDDVEHGDDD